MWWWRARLIKGSKWASVGISYKCSGLRVRHIVSSMSISGITRARIRTKPTQRAFKRLMGTFGGGLALGGGLAFGGGLALGGGGLCGGGGLA